MKTMFARRIPTVALLLTAALLLSWFAFTRPTSAASTYEVGPGKPYQNINDVPWESLQAGDTVLIYYRSTPYKEKFVITAQGTAQAPITIRGVPGPNGELPVIDGNGATTRRALDFWAENRGVIKVGGSSVPADVTPTHIIIENLEIRSARPGYTFTDDSGNVQSYAESASAIYIEKGENITVRNCIMHDCGNGFFVASSNSLASRNILVEGNYIYNNGIEGSIYQHNVYTAAIGITFQYNRLGPLRPGCNGNNLKDRSAGTVIRYNWIEGGNRQLDLVDGEDSSLIRNHPSYHTAYVYGNVLIETAGAGNNQITHFGGDSGNSKNYRNGPLYFYNNTIVSYRTDRTCLFRLSSNNQSCDARNNIFYKTVASSQISLMDEYGTLNLSHNWINTGYVNSFGNLKGTINDDGTQIVGTAPGFVNLSQQNFRLASGSPCINAGGSLNPAVLPTHNVVYEYVKHQSGQARPVHGALDIGAFEY